MQSATISVFKFSAIQDAPIVKATTTTTVTLEFLPSNGSSSRFYVRYKLSNTFDETTYTWGVYVSDDGRSAPMTYTVIQNGLKPNTEYNFKIAAAVEADDSWWSVTEFNSPVVRARTRAVGKS